VKSRFWVTSLIITAGALLAVQTASAKLLLHETVTITLDDGTKIVCVLDDKGMPSLPRGGRSAKMKKAKFDFQQRVAAREQEYRDRWEWWKQSADDEENGGKKLNHAVGIYFWPGVVKIPEKHYYYLPPPPKISVDKDGKPQFLFIKFVTDKTKEQGGASGGIFHFLAEYGLTPEQEKELAEKLEEKIKGAKLMGAVPMEGASEESTFRVISATLSDQGFTRSMVTSGRAPLLPGQKVAVAARLDDYGATLLAKTLEKPTSDVSIEFDLAYTAFVPAFDGKMSFNWERFKSHIEDYKLKYRDRKECWWWIFGCKHNYTTEEMRQVYDMLCEEEVVTIEWTEEIVDERLEMIRQAFLQLMEKMFFNRTMDFAEDEEDDSGDESAVEAETKGRGSDFYRFVAMSEDSFSNKTYYMRTQLPVKVEFTTVGNISGAWYLESKDRYPDLFDEINLDDPFFQHRKIMFNLDVDAAKIFDEMINYVTVEVRKRRSGGPDFADSVTIDSEYLKENGRSAWVNYAKMREEDPGVYEYKVQWSLAGGGLFPRRPSWHRGEWEGVSLSAPIKSLEIMAQADLEDLRQNDVVMATVQLRYSRYGQRYEDPEAIRISVAEGNPILTKWIYRDADNPNYEYRVTFYHKRKGRVQGRWQRGTEDGFILCVLPESLRKQEEGE